jgi:Spy/CpxP family protein refolding chaperone
MFRRLIIILSIMLALAGTVAAAQKGLRGRRAGGRLGARLQDQLNLNETQKNGIRALQETRQKELGSLRQELQQKRQALRELMQQTNPNPNDVGNATLALRETRERMREINQRFLSGMKGLLTPDQLQKLPNRLR